METKEFTLRMLEKAYKKVEMSEIKPLNNGLCQVAESIIGGEKFVQELDNAIKQEIHDIVIDEDRLKKYLKNK